MRHGCEVTGQLLPEGMCPKCRAYFRPGEPISCSEEVHAICLRFDDPEQVAALRASLARRPESPGEEIARLKRTIEGMAARTAAQSELLSRRAER